MLLMVGGFAMATTTDFLDLSKTTTIGNLTFDSTTSTITTTVGTDMWAINSAPGLQTILTLKINLTQASRVSTDTNIVTLDFTNPAKSDVGLMATSTGLSASLGGSTENRSSVSWTDLATKTNCLTMGSDGDQYIVLSFAHIPNGAYGASLADDTGYLFKDVNARYADGLDTLAGIKVNTALLAAIEVKSDWATPNTLVVPFVTTSAGSIIPEPATATLSLLALCGLAARRRRK